MNFYLGQRDELVAMHRDFTKQLKEMKENLRVEKERLEQEKLRLEQEQKERQEKERQEKERKEKERKEKEMQSSVRQPVKRSLNFSNVAGSSSSSVRPVHLSTAGIQKALGSSVASSTEESSSDASDVLLSNCSSSCKYQNNLFSCWRQGHVKGFLNHCSFIYF